MKKIVRFIIAILLVIVLINLYVILTTRNKIVDIDNLQNDYDCIIVLGASVRGNQPSLMLEDRLITTLDLYNKGVSKKILVSGDNHTDDYDEVTVMKNYLMDHNVNSNVIFIDRYGVSTYDSIYRAKKIYKANNVVIVTQGYHLYRSLYIAKQLDLKAVGVKANEIRYSNQWKRDIREIFARFKDFIKCIYEPEALKMGEVFPITRNENNTDKKDA